MSQRLVIEDGWLRGIFHISLTFFNSPITKGSSLNFLYKTNVSELLITFHFAWIKQHINLPYFCSWEKITGYIDTVGWRKNSQFLISTQDREPVVQLRYFLKNKQNSQFLPLECLLWIQGESNRSESSSLQCMLTQTSFPIAAKKARARFHNWESLMVSYCTETNTVLKHFFMLQ